MVISLDNEISPYEPFGRSIIESIPNPNLTSRQSKSDRNNSYDDNLVSDNGENFAFNNDFITAELDQCRDLFRSINEIYDGSSSKTATNITDRFPMTDFWRLRKTTKGEEEIYVNLNSLILSHRPSNNNGQSFLDKSLTLPDNIIDALWCDFTITDDNNLAMSASIGNDHQHHHYSRKRMKILKTLCILDEHYRLHILSDNGDYYQKHLPFRVGKMVATIDHGLLFERIIGSESREMPDFPAIYSLSNPLNDLSPVLMIMPKSSSSSSSTAQSFSNQQLKLINIIVEKNLAIFYCSHNNCHQIYQFRSVKDRDIHQLFLHHHYQQQQQQQQNYLNISNNQKSVDNNNHMMVTPENPCKRQQQFTNFGITSSISRSLSNNLIQQMVQKQGSSTSLTTTSGGLLHHHHHHHHNNRNSSSPLSTQYHSPLRHSSSLMHHHHNLNKMDVIDIPRTTSPSVLMSNLITSRMDSPTSPNPLNIYHTTNPRLTDLDIEMYLDSSRNTTLMIDSPNLNRIFQPNSPLNMTNQSLAAQSSPSSSLIVNMNGTISSSINTSRTIDQSPSTIERSSARFLPNEFELAMEHIWSETSIHQNHQTQSSHSMATKVFITRDFLGQNYLGLVINTNNRSNVNLMLSSSDSAINNNSSILKLIRFDQASTTNEDSTNNNSDEKMKFKYIFTATKIFTVKDAQPLPSLSMIIVVDETNTLILYSGVFKVAIIHLQQPTMSYLMLQSSFPMESSSSSTTTPAKLSSCHISTTNATTLLRNSLKFQTPTTSPLIVNTNNFTPELSELLEFSPPSSSTNNITGQTSRLLHSSPFDYSTQQQQQQQQHQNHHSQKISSDFVFIQPQCPGQFGKIIGLCDSIDNRVTIVQRSSSAKDKDDYRLYRLSFPLMASTFLVDKCLAALRQLLPKDQIIHLLAAWYTYRNSTNNEEDIPECILFKLCLFSSIGFDKERLKQYYHCKNEIICSSSTMMANSNLTFNLSTFNDDQQRSSSNNDLSRMESSKKIRIDNDIDNNGNDDDFYQLMAENNIDWIDRPPPSSSSSSASILNKQQSSSLLLSLKSEHFTCPGFLYPYTAHILYSLHLVYEDLKLVEMNWPLCRSLVDLLYLLAANLNLSAYLDHYYRDFSEICMEISSDSNQQFKQHTDRIIYPPYFCTRPPSVYNTLYTLLNNEEDQTTTSAAASTSILFPYLGSATKLSPKSSTTTMIGENSNVVTPNIFNMILLYSNLNCKQLIHPQLVLQHVGHNSFNFDSNPSAFVNMKKFEQIIELYDDQQNDDRNSRSKDSKEKILLLMSALDITREYIKRLPFGLALPLWNIVYHFRDNPKKDWCSSIYSLIDRPDLSALEQQQPYCFARSSASSNAMAKQMTTNEILTTQTINMNEELEYFDLSVLRLLFPNDQRLHEAYRMLLSSKPMVIDIKQEPGVPDNEFVEEQEKHLLALSFRTMALPLGRGMVTLRSYSPTVIERFPIPPLVLHGKVPPRHLIHLSHIDVPPNMNVWPLFHNGVSAGLRISSAPNRMVDSSWILYNKPSNNQSADDHYEHAGFLLALGLNGLLDNLSIIHLHDYLSKGNDLTKVAILLGLSASRRGTMDSTVFALLGIHLEGLLPSTSTELDVSPIVRVAAVLGTGLLFQATGNRYIAKVMLTEIGRPPGPEMEHYIDRESYALSAGLAFGLVTLGRGNQLINVTTSDGISIPDQLNHYMLGVHKKMSTLQKEKTKTPSYHIREGDCINADVTSPGATLALGMMFFDTGNAAIVQWLEVPATQNLLEMRNTNVEKGLENEMMFIDDVDYETMTQSYCNIIAGACFALALRYAGTANDQAFQVVYKYTSRMVTLSQKGTNTQIEQAGRSTIESCVNVLIVACSIIMAGTGNVDIMRICRFLRCRVNQTHVLYGSFMAIHLALGLLFLGGCRMTLNSSPESVAALICAFFPKYPIHTNDNRYHLQAFRHLYALASQPRLLIPTCIDTGVSLYARIRYTFKTDYEQSSVAAVVEKTAPCLLPDLNRLETVELIDSNYWPIEFENGKNFIKLEHCLASNGGHLYIKRRLKGFSYNKDFIYDNSNAKIHGGGRLSLSNGRQLNQKSFTLFDFTNETILKTFFKIFNQTGYHTDGELRMKNKINSILYDCAEDERLDLFIPSIQLIASCIAIVSRRQQQSPMIMMMMTANNVGSSNGGTNWLKPITEYKTNKSLILCQIRIASNYLNQHRSIRSMMSIYRMIETIRFQLEDHIRTNVNLRKLSEYIRGQLSIQQICHTTTNNNNNGDDESLIESLVYFNIMPFTNDRSTSSVDDNVVTGNMNTFNIIKWLKRSNQSALFLCDIWKNS
ncbi:anaphase-promoting complex subunit 1-like protein [Dermatophagoides farinae]|uniref:Anaphase-promoting complex subunit 1-like protein n=1 Tax=Dermatophagoides farinae TaxID=6954 RepID=A0A9D4P185_DERFA|nr:anaphase-promoting complex subunit 1-like protein [Dermatophagoides farinae]